MRAAFRLEQAVCGVLLVMHSVSARSVVDYLQANLSSEWNEDLEPAIESLTHRLQRLFLPVGQEILYDETLSPECFRSFMRIALGLRDGKLWALKFLDSNGALTVNKIDGTLASIGGYDECLSIRVPQSDEPYELDFAGKYCTVSIHLDRQPMLYRLLPEFLVQEPMFLEYLGPNATWVLEMLEKLPLGIRTGICIPSKCEESIISHLAQKFGGRYGLRAQPLACKDDITETPVHTGTWIAGFVFLTATVLLTWGTIGDCRNSPDNRDLRVRLMRCFSARVSYLKLAASPVAEENRDFDCIHGIRVVSSLWILFAHTYLGDPALYDRAVHFLTVLRSPVFSIVTQGMLAVDTFFALTGILLYRKLYSAIVKERILDKISLIQFVAMVIFRRAFRLLVPALAVVSMLYLLPVVTSGPGMDAFYPYFRKNCDQRWWAQLLFVNNFWSFELACMGNQWYNAADMQLFAILFLPTVFMVRRPRQGFLLIGLFIIFSNLYTAFLTIYYDAAPTTLILIRQMLQVLQFGLHINDQSLPYLATMCVGILGGYFIEHCKESKISPLIRKAGWSLTGTLSFFIIFVVSVWNRRGSVSKIEAVVYGALYRPLWGLCVVWLVFACASGKAPVLRWMLNRPNLVILSRLSYCFYLSQFIVILVKNFTARYVVAFTYYQNFRDFFADMIFNYLLAFLIFLLFEAPAYALDKLAFEKSTQRMLKSKLADVGGQKSTNDTNKNVFDTPSGIMINALNGDTPEPTYMHSSKPESMLNVHARLTYKL